jgi:uncharacterized protein
MAGDKARGRFVWYDLMTADPDGATAFYGKVAGWGTTQWDGAGQGQAYTMWTVGQTPIGGVMTLPEEARKMGAPPHWLAYIGTPDLDSAIQQAEALGAKVMVSPMNVPTVGRFAVLADPQGAIIAMFTAESDAPGHDGPPAISEFSWHELATTEPAGAFSFYHELFGWQKTGEMDMGADGMYTMYGRTEMPLGGIFRKPAEMPGGPAWLYYVRVPDVNAAIETIKANGGQLLHGPMEVPGGDWIAQCMDPQGAMFAVHQVNQA